MLAYQWLTKGRWPLFIKKITQKGTLMSKCFFTYKLFINRIFLPSLSNFIKNLRKSIQRHLVFYLLIYFPFQERKVKHSLPLATFRQFSCLVTLELKKLISFPRLQWSPSMNFGGRQILPSNAITAEIMRWPIKTKSPL